MNLRGESRKTWYLQEVEAANEPASRISISDCQLQNGCRPGRRGS